MAMPADVHSVTILVNVGNIHICLYKYVSVQELQI